MVWGEMPTSAEPLIAIAVGAFALLYLWERRVDDPVIPVKLLSQAVILRSNFRELGVAFAHGNPRVERASGATFAAALGRRTF